MGQTADLLLILVCLYQIAIQFVLATNNTVATRRSLNTTSDAVSSSNSLITTKNNNNSDEIWTTRSASNSDNLARLLKIMAESGHSEEQETKMAQDGDQAKVPSTGISDNTTTTTSSTTTSQASTNFNENNHLFIKPTEERQVVISDRIHLKKELRLLKRNMTIGFDKSSKANPEIHWVVLYNATTILAVRSATKYHYWELEQTVSSVIIFIMIVVGNLSILFKLKGSTKRRRSNVNYFIVQLARADLLVGLVNVTLDLFLRKQKTYPWGLAACKASKYFPALFIYSSINVLVALSYDRWEVIVKPMNISRNRSRGFHLVTAAWLIACLCAAPVLFFTHIREIDGKPQCWIHLDKLGWRIYLVYMEFIILVAPVISITICYTQIVYTIWKKGQFLIKPAEQANSKSVIGVGATRQPTAATTSTNSAIVLQSRRRRAEEDGRDAIGEKNEGSLVALAEVTKSDSKQVKRANSSNHPLVGQSKDLHQANADLISKGTQELRFSLERSKDDDGHINGQGHRGEQSSINNNDGNYIIRSAGNFVDSKLAATRLEMANAIESNSKARNDPGDNLIPSSGDEPADVVFKTKAFSETKVATTTTTTTIPIDSQQVNGTLGGDTSSERGGGGVDNGGDNISLIVGARKARLDVDGEGESEQLVGALSDDHYKGSDGQAEVLRHERNATIETIERRVAPTPAAAATTTTTISTKRKGDQPLELDKRSEFREGKAKLSGRFFAFSGSSSTKQRRAPSKLAASNINNKRHSTDGHPMASTMREEAPSGSGNCVIGKTGGSKRLTSNTTNTAIASNKSRHRQLLTAPNVTNAATTAIAATSTITTTTTNYVTSQASTATQQHGSGVIPKARIKTIKMTLVIVIAYILCWLPFCVFNLLSVFDLLEETNFNNALGTFTQSLAHLNSAVNPIIFWMFSSKRPSHADNLKRHSTSWCFGSWWFCGSRKGNVLNKCGNNHHNQNLNYKTDGRFNQVGSSSNNNNNNNPISGCGVANSDGANQRRDLTATTATSSMTTATSLTACRSLKYNHQQRNQNLQRFSIRVRSLDADLDVKQTSQGQEGCYRSSLGGNDNRDAAENLAKPQRFWPMRLLTGLLKPFGFTDSSSNNNHKQHQQKQSIPSEQVVKSRKGTGETNETSTINPLIC